MKRMSLMIALLALVLVFGAAGSAFASEIEENAAPTGAPELIEEMLLPDETLSWPVEIASATGTFEVEMGAQLQLSVEAQGMEAVSVRWTSSNPHVAYVENGRVIGVSEGTARIRADYIFAEGSSQRGASSVREVRVNAPGDLSISPARGAQIVPGEAVELTVELRNAGVSSVHIRWTSSDPAVAVVEHGSVRGVAPGSAVITAQCEYTADGEKYAEEYSCLVEVIGIVLENVPAEALQPGETAKLRAALVGIRPDEAVFSWTSSDETVARVREDSVVEAVAPGSAQISVVCDYGSGEAAGSVSAGAEVLVTEPVRFEVLSGTGGSFLSVEETIKLAVSGYGEGLQSYSVAWSSENAEIAAIDANGCVTGVSEGAATVTAQVEYICAGGICMQEIPFEITVGE